MYYFTFPAPIRYPQITLDDLLHYDFPNYVSRGPIGKVGDTRTYAQDTIPLRLRSAYEETAQSARVAALQDFIRKYDALYRVPRRSLYRSFSIPKRNGRPRPIDAPKDELMIALRELKGIFETLFHANCLYHTSAFAYVGGRSHHSALQRHQQNQSRWFLKLDCANFFGSTTKDFTMRMLYQIWPFSRMAERASTRTLLEKAIDLAFLDGVLPQGTPLSPLLTNIVMIPFDFTVSNALRDLNGNHLIYTRYADDLTISCRYDFRWSDVVSVIETAFRSFNAPYHLNYEKTHYGSCAGRNWILGLMYNKDQQITLGKKRKDALRASICDYVRARGTDLAWSYSELKSLDGNISYFRSIEPQYTQALLAHYQKKLGVPILETLRADIKSFGQP